MSGSSQPTYATQQFYEYTIAFEGNALACILFGVYLTITGINVSLLRKKRYRFLLSYTIVQLVITMAFFPAVLYTTPRKSLVAFNMTGPPAPGTLSTWPAVVAAATYFLNTWASDGFLLYRCYAICLGNKYALALPTLLYLSTISSSIAWFAVSPAPALNYLNFGTRAVHITGICYWSSSTVMNICTACLISVRLWMHRKAISKVLGSERDKFYLRYIAVTLESTLLYTVFAIIASVTFMLDNPLKFLFTPVLGAVQVIVPALIIYRVARGISSEPDEDGSITMSSLHFTP